MNATTEITKPSAVAICSGRYENDAIASNENRSIFPSVNFVFPA